MSVMRGRQNSTQRLRLVAVRVIGTRQPGAGLEGKQNFEFNKVPA